MTHMTHPALKITATTLALLCACGSAPAQTTFPESEPNNTKASATPINDIAPGDTISGASTGSSTTATGNGTADYFLVHTAPMPLNIYRYRLVSTTAANFPTTIRGLTVTNCIPNQGTDSAQQNATSLSTPPRMVQWYGFGREEQLFFRVTGTSSTTQPYGWTLARDLVTPLDAPGLLAPGPITINPAPGNTTDLDMAIYTEALTPITGFSNGGSNTLTRSYTPGVYYLAVSRRSFANDQICPNDDTNRSAGAMDFPDILVAFSNIAPTDVSMRLSDGVTAIDLPATAPGAFDIAWIRFVVAAPPTCGTSDFNGDSDFGTDADIEAFFACLAGNCCPTCFPGGSDFNGDGDSGTDQDIESFFRVLAGGTC
jgi:hypothetical protein